MPGSSLSKYLDIARTIESQNLGRHGEKVPSARAIAREYGVSLVTASRAIQVLKDKGLIRTVERSGSFVTAGLPAESGRECYAMVQRSTPGPWFQASLSASQGGFAAIQRREGVRFETDAIPFDDATKRGDLQRMARRAVESGVSGIVFLPSRYKAEAARQDEVFLECCQEVGLAIVLIERNLRGQARPLEYDLVAADDFDGGLRCTEHLRAQGRRRIAFVIGSPTSSHLGRMAGYLTSLQALDTDWRPLVLEHSPEIASGDSYEELADQVLSHAADGVVVYQDYAALGLILELLKRGVGVPADVAVTGFDNLPIGKAYSIGVTTYAFSSEAVAYHATRLLRTRRLHPANPPVKVLIPGELIVRESSDPAH